MVNSTAVDLYWCQPSRPNGLLKRYHLLRDGVSVYESSPNETKHTDTNLQPNTRSCHHSHLSLNTLLAANYQGLLILRFQSLLKISSSQTSHSNFKSFQKAIRKFVLINTAAGFEGVHQSSTVLLCTVTQLK